MLSILIAIIITTALAWFLILYFADGSSGLSFFMAATGCVLAIYAFIALVFYAFAAWKWSASGYQTSIINREYGTNYTQEEVFWASNVIDTVRELDRKRIEVNGNVLRCGDAR